MTICILIGPTTGTIAVDQLIELVFFFSKSQTFPTQENHKIKRLFNVAPYYLLCCEVADQVMCTYNIYTIN